MRTIIERTTRGFWHNDSGVAALIFALSLPMFVSAAGIAVDLAQAYNVKNRLADSLDKASLAGGSTQGSAAEVEERVTRFFNANYPADKLGTPLSLDIVVGADATVSVSATARVDMTFMGVMGYEYLDVSAETIVKRELAGVEAVLVLDVTGSMAGSRIVDLRTAATNFVNIMFERIEDPEFIKIGIVPYSASVNVGSYGLGLDPEGDAYDAPFVDHPATDPYVSPASNITHGSGGNNWRGCILERTSPDDTNDDAAPNWGMYRYPRICGSWYNGNCQWWSNNDPNRYCPVTPILPLTNSQEAMLSTISTLAPDGGTYGNVGLAWGFRVITPTAPFTEGVALDDDTWTRTIVMMTDGDNSIWNQYSAYGANPGLSNANLNSKMTTVCDNIKAEGITIYTITFDSGVSAATKDFYRSCATDPGKYFDTDDGDELVTAFEDIANQLSQLHIVK